ncbi:MAG: hypothetical protein ACKOQ4_04095 [Mycobacterium sp.]
MDTNRSWPPPAGPPPPGYGRRIPRSGRSWLPAAIIGSAIVIAAGLVAGALILNGKKDATADGTTCQAWTETRQTLQAIPALPGDWTWQTPNIDTYIRLQNAPVGTALDLFEPKIAAEPADVAQAARDYVAVRRKQMQALRDRSYTAPVGAEVDAALEHLDQLCGTSTGARPV